jgi:hypothetical protein
MQRFTQPSIIIYSGSQTTYSDSGHMSVRNLLVTTTQQKYINIIQLHLLVFNTCYAKRPIFHNRELSSINVRQKSQKVSFLPNDRQHTLSSRTRGGAGTNFHQVLLNMSKEKQTCQLNKTQEKASQSRNRS